MRNPARPFAVLVVLLSSGGCTQRGLDEFRASDALARSAIEGVRTGGVDGLRPHLDPETARLPQLDAEVRTMRAALPSQAPDAVQLVTSETESGWRNSTTRLLYRIRGQGKCAEAELWIENRGGTRKVETLRISDLPGSQCEARA